MSQLLYLYTSNDNPTYLGNVFRVLSLPNEYIIQFPYQRKHIDGQCQDKLKSYQEAVICFTCDQARSLFATEKNLDIPIRRAKIIAVQEEAHSDVYIFSLALGNFIDQPLTLTRQGKRTLFVTDRLDGFENPCSYHKYNNQSDCSHQHPCPNKIQESSEKIKDSLQNQKKGDWHQVISAIEPHFENTPLFYYLESIDMKAPIWACLFAQSCWPCRLIFTVLSLIIFFTTALIIQIFSSSTIGVALLMLGIVLLTLCSVCNFKCPFSQQKKEHRPNSTPLPVSYQNNQSFFRLAENQTYQLKIHTRFNKKSQPDLKTRNYFIEPVQTDDLLSGNIQERFFANNRANTHYISFTSHYLDMHQNSCDLIFRLHQTNLNHPNSGDDQNVNQPLYYLDTPIRIEVHKPVYKVSVMALLLTLVKTMFEVIFKTENDFTWSNFIAGYTSCCQNWDWSIAGCQWDNFIVSYLVIFAILLTQHYLYKSFSTRTSRIHHH